MRFDWDSRKATANRRKHRVSFEEACTIFADRSVLTTYDEIHSSGEERWVSIGMAQTARLLVVIHTWPVPDEADEETLTIVSARRANQREQAIYLERRL